MENVHIGSVWFGSAQFPFEIVMKFSFYFPLLHWSLISDMYKPDQQAGRNTQWYVCYAWQLRERWLRN